MRGAVLGERLGETHGGSRPWYWSSIRPIPTLRSSVNKSTCWILQRGQCVFFERSSLSRWKAQVLKQLEVRSALRPDHPIHVVKRNGNQCSSPQIRVWGRARLPRD